MKRRRSAARLVVLQIAAILLAPWPLCAQATPRGSAPDPVVRALMPAWMAGCWEQRSERTLVEEQWTLPRGGIMLGSGRTTHGDTLADFEQTRIVAVGDTLVFFALPRGQAPAEFRARSVGDGEVRFENLAHDFPQRVVYRRAGADSLVARVEGMRRGVLRGVDFRYRRVPCPGR